jgi:hypothetical protein
MAFTTRYQGQIVIAETPTDMVFGTVMLGQIYGQVLSANLTREADVERVRAAGSLLALILIDPLFKLELETMFRSDVEPPALAELITFPFAGIQGRVLPPISVTWEERGHRKLKIMAESWDAFAATNQGGGSAYTFDGTDYTPIVD